MANTKNTKKESPSSIATPEEEVSVNDVYNVLKFANALYSGSLGVGVFTPELINQALQNITMNPLEPTVAKVNAALRDPKANEDNLIGYSEWSELNSMIYKRVMLYFSGLLAFNFTYVCTNATTEEDYKSSKYERDLAVVAEFFDKFDHKQEFRTAMKEMLRNEAFFSVLRDDTESFVLQELPRNRCKITGRFDKGILFDFDMYYFLESGVALDMYPDIFTKMYNDVFGETSANPKPYIPAANLSQRTGSFVLWKQTSPQDGFTCFKFSPEIGTLVPFLSPLLADTVLQPTIRELQTNSYIQEATRILVGAVPFLKDSKASVKDSIALDPETLGKFLQLVKSGLPDAIKVAAAPLEDMAGIDFKGSTDIYDSFLKSTASASGINSRLIYSFDRQNVMETKLSMNVDENIVRPIYSQMEKMLEYWINSRTKKYKFKITLEGFNTSIDKEERLDTALKLADSGIVLEQKISAAIDMSPFDLRRMMMEGKANDFVNNLTPIMKSNQLSSGVQDAGGRPVKSDSDLSDGGADTRADGENIEKES